MGHYRISELAALFGLSRSTLLYYDRIGLLRASGRNVSGYRTYDDRDRRRLSRIRMFRQAGFGVHDVGVLLRSEHRPPARVLERRMAEIDEEIQALRAQQRLLSKMLEQLAVKPRRTVVDRTVWTQMLRAAGLDQDGMRRWHREFEARAPEAHHEFLLALGIEEADARAIRAWANEGGAQHVGQSGRRGV